MSAAEVGKHIIIQTTNNFSYVDKLALVAPLDLAFKELLNLRKKFASEHYIVYNIAE